MRIGIDASVVVPPLSGVQLAVRHQCRALLRCLPHESATVFSHDEIVREAAVGAGARLVQMPFSTRRPPVRLLWQQLCLPHCLKGAGVDLLYAPAYTAPLKGPIPFVLQVHDLIALEHPEWCATRNVLHMRMLLAASARRAAAILVASGCVRTGLVQRLSIPAARIHVFPLGVDFTGFARPQPVAPGASWRDGRPYVLFVGNLEPKKGLHTLLDAYATVADTMAADLVVAGRPAWKSRELCQRMRAYTGPGRIQILGRVTGADLPALYQHASALVLPSLSEGFGLPVLEAMAAGVPVVHSDCPALVETAGGAGICFQRGDAHGLAAALRRVHESATARVELREQGRARARSLSWERWAAAALTVFRSVCGS